MKKSVLILSMLAMFAFIGCSKTENNTQSTAPTNSTQTESEAKDTRPEGWESMGQVDSDEIIWFESTTDNGAVFDYAQLPRTLKQLETTVDFHDEYSVAGGLILCLAVYENDPELSLKMLDYLNGPEDVSAYDKSFIKEQFSQYPYVMRSYFKGATPENNYTPSDAGLEVEITENMYSRVSDDSVVLRVQSGGADSQREIGLRYKASTDEWFVYNYSSLLAGIRAPKALDKWA